MLSGNIQHRTLRPYMRGGFTEQGAQPSPHRPTRLASLGTQSCGLWWFPSRVHDQPAARALKPDKAVIYAPV